MSSVWLQKTSLSSWSVLRTDSRQTDDGLDSMALPNDLLDELLSAYLDGAASSDECARAEQLIADDQAVAERYQSLVDQRDRLRELASQRRQTPYRLPNNFAETVVASAIDRVKSEGGDENHPLLIAERNSDITPANRAHAKGIQPVLAAVFVALAASLLFVFFAPKRPDVHNAEQIAQSQPEVTATPDESAIASNDTVGHTAAAGGDVSPDGATFETMEPGRQSDSGESETAEPAIEGVAADRGNSMIESPRGTEPEPQIASSADGESVAKDDRKPTDVRTVPAETPTAVAPLNMLMVVKVELTDAGRSENAFDEATSTLRFELTEERPVNAALAAAVEADSARGESEAGELSQDGRVLLLESPAKKLDRLINTLASDRGRIDSVSFSLLSASHDAPILKAVNAARLPDPTRIQHEGRGIPLVGADSAENQFAAWQNQLADRQFAPITPATASMVSAMGTGQPMQLRMSANAGMPNTMRSGNRNPVDGRPANGGSADSGSLSEGLDQMANVLFLIR